MSEKIKITYSTLASPNPKLDELYDEAFHDRAVRRVAAALADSLQDATPVTHIGTGQVSGCSGVGSLAHTNSQ